MLIFLKVLGAWNITKFHIHSIFKNISVIKTIHPSFRHFTQDLARYKIRRYDEVMKDIAVKVNRTN